MKLNELIKKNSLLKTPGLWVIYVLGLAIVALQIRSLF